MIEVIELNISSFLVRIEKTNKYYLSRNIADQFVGKSVRPGKTQKLIPVSGDHIGNIKPRHESHRDNFRKPG